jgi:ketosteroid isomerase-like protein
MGFQCRKCQESGGKGLKAQIVANNAAWAAAANNGDAAGVAAMYTENATMVPPGQNSVRQVGRAAIE